MEDTDIFDIGAPEEKEEDTGFATELERGKHRTKDIGDMPYGTTDPTDPILAFNYNPRDEAEKNFLENEKKKEKLKKEHEEEGLPPPRDWLEYTPLNKEKKKEDQFLSVQNSQREAVVLMVACGISNASIARILGSSVATLKNRYQKELDYGKDMLTIRVANAVVQKALDGNIPAAQLFLKARAGWKEATSVEISGKDGLPLISGIEREQRILHMMTQNPELMEKLRQKRLGLANVVDVTPEDPEEDIFNLT